MKKINFLKVIITARDYGYGFGAGVFNGNDQQIVID